MLNEEFQDVLREDVVAGSQCVTWMGQDTRLENQGEIWLQLSSRRQHTGSSHQVSVGFLGKHAE